MTPLLEGTLTAAKKDCSPLHHLDTRLLDLAMPFQSSDCSGGEGNFDSTSDRALRKARRSEQRQGELENDTAAGHGDTQPASEKARKFRA